MSEALAGLVGKEHVPLDARLAGILSFTYTYHYLNWFIKERVINWHKIPKLRLLTILAISVAATGLYLYDYGLGLTVLFSLSLLHVVLEFPLNAVTIRRLATSMAATRGLSLLRIRTTLSVDIDDAPESP